MLKFNKKQKPSRIGLTERKNMVGYLFCLPLIIGIVLIFIPAIIDAIRYSFNDVQIDFSKINLESVGFDNYVKAFTGDKTFLPLLLETIKGTVIDLLVITFFSFFIANVLNQKFVGRGFTRAIFFLPVLLSTGIIAAADTNNMATALFGSGTNDGSGIASAFSGGMSFLDLQGLLEKSNLDASIVDFITTTVNNTYDVVNSSGVQILIFLSALQSISPALYEAAKVEGATKWEEFWKITFPMLTPMILVNMVYTVVDSFINPKYGMLNLIQTHAFSNNQIGYASALSWVYFLLVLILLGIVWLMFGKRVQYLD